MANAQHVTVIKEGVAVWNEWRRDYPDVRPDLTEANLSGANLRKVHLGRANLGGANLADTDLYKADLQNTNLGGANLSRTNLYKADLYRADLSDAKLQDANLSKARLTRGNLRKAQSGRADFGEADLSDANLGEADFSESDLNRAHLRGASLVGAGLRKANLYKANLYKADLSDADLRKANLSSADLSAVDFSRADLSRADLGGADLSGADLLETNFSHTNLTGCYVYGVSVWNVNLAGAIQKSLVITPRDEPAIQVDDLEMAQFIYLLLDRQKLRNVITTLGEKGVLILGRFTERKELLDGIAAQLRECGYLPIIFDFERPTDRDLTETVKILAGLSAFVIADITNPRSVPLELQATVPDYMVPFVTILQEGQPAFGMFDDLPRKYHWALPLLEYPSAELLLANFEDAVIQPALKKLKRVRREKAAPLSRRKIK